MSDSDCFFGGIVLGILIMGILYLMFIAFMVNGTVNVDNNNIDHVCSLLVGENAKYLEDDNFDMDSTDEDNFLCETDDAVYDFTSPINIVKTAEVKAYRRYGEY